jgi:signal peptidase II
VNGTASYWATASAIAVGIAAIDQSVKRLVTGALLPGESHPLIPGLLHLTYQQNTGITFSLLQHVPTLVLVLLTVVMLGVFLVLIAPYTRRRFSLTATACILGGGVGNLLDRIFRYSGVFHRTYVVDFLDLRLHDRNIWPVFNLADTAIVIGVILLASVVLMAEQKKAVSPEGASV